MRYLDYRSSVVVLFIRQQKDIWLTKMPINHCGSLTVASVAVFLHYRIFMG